MRVLLLGKSGQVGYELARVLAPAHELSALDRAALDLADLDAVRRAVRAARPEAIVNAAAYTAVDRAESEPERAMRINADAPGVLAEEARRTGALLVHYSTDYVFDGEKRSPYAEDDAPNPLGAYGRSKLEGERRIAASGCRHFIFRTSWVYGPRGTNFPLTILRLARERPELRVVDDQRGAPTSSIALAQATARILASAPSASAPSGVYHMSAAGETTWHGFAKAILEAAGLKTALIAIPTSAYPTAARRPKNSVLDNSRLRAAFGIELAHWRDAFREIASKISAFSESPPIAR